MRWPRRCDQVAASALGRLSQVKPAVKSAVLVLSAAVAALLLHGLAEAAPAAPSPLVVPFDFSRGAIDLEVKVHGQPLRMILDTGVDPSVIDLSRAQALGLKIDRGDAGEATGFGEGKGAQVFPGVIDQLTIDGQPFAAFDTLASDMSGLSAGYGRPLDGVIGYSFLADKTVLIDYPGQTVAFLNNAGQAKGLTATCRQRWSTSLKTVDSFPIIPGFRFGAARAPVSLDTGSNGAVGLFKSALGLPGVKASLAESGSVTRTGARGEAKAKSYVLKAPVGFGPFTATDTPMSVYSEAGSTKTRVANVGNKLMAQMKLKVLFDYRGKRMVFYGACDG